MRSKNILTTISMLVSLTMFSGCAFFNEANFPISVGNRTRNTIKVFANGAEMGDVDAGQTRSFSVKLRTVYNSGYGVAPTQQAQVTFYARDLKTGALSREKGWTVVQDRPTNIEFNPSDFVQQQ